MSEAGLQEEVVELAQELIRIDTSNPPGRETPAAELLASYLTEAGAECELDGPDPERLNLIARVRGGDGPSLMLLAHTDVVPAPGEGWSVGPFEGVVRDGHLIGRGASDMKGELASRAVALARTARSAEPPPGDVVLVAESDEERNLGACGLSWVVRERPDVRCDYALNEGGGTLLRLADGRAVVTMSVGEKEVTSIRVRIHGRAGHASVPEGADNAVDNAATAVKRLLACGAQPKVIPAIRRALDALGAPADDDEAIAWASAQHPELEGLMPAMTRMTVTPTGLRTFEPSNVIPPFADVVCDCRALPGDGEDDIRAHVARALGDDLRYEVELLEPIEGGTESPIDTPLFRACEQYVTERLPGAVIMPLVSPGFTDSHWIRGAHGTIAYGFAPVFATDPIRYSSGFHSADESISVDDLLEITQLNLHVIRSLASA